MPLFILVGYPDPDAENQDILSLTSGGVLSAITDGTIDWRIAFYTADRSELIADYKSGSPRTYQFWRMADDGSGAAMLAEISTGGGGPEPLWGYFHGSSSNYKIVTSYDNTPVAAELRVTTGPSSPATTTILTSGDIPGSTSSTTFDSAHWSPNGNKIGFIHSVFPSDPRDRVFICDADGSNLIVPVMPCSVGTHYLEWKHDNSGFFFVGSPTTDGSVDGGFCIWFCTVAGSISLVYNSGTNIFQLLQLSPDGTKLAWVSTDGLSVMNSDGSGGVTNLSSAGRSAPAWSLNSQFVASITNELDGSTGVAIFDAVTAARTTIYGGGGVNHFLGYPEDFVWPLPPGIHLSQTRLS